MDNINDFLKCYEKLNKVVTRQYSTLYIATYEYFLECPVHDGRITANDILIFENVSETLDWIKINLNKNHIISMVKIQDNIKTQVPVKYDYCRHKYVQCLLAETIDTKITMQYLLHDTGNGTLGWEFAEIKKI